jgi:hypothetical protein
MEFKFHHKEEWSHLNNWMYYFLQKTNIFRTLLPARILRYLGLCSVPVFCSESLYTFSGPLSIPLSRLGILNTDEKITGFKYLLCFPMDIPVLYWLLLELQNSL